MSMSNDTENDILEAILKGTDPAWRAGATIYVALYTADPGEAGTAVTNEATYTSYARVAVTKASGWNDGGSTFDNAALIQFPQCTGGTNTITHFGLVTTSAGAGQLLVSAALSSSLAVSSGIQPQFAAGDLTVTAD
ncbi:MAG TPA: hypothetical protein PK694_01315 [Rhodospirillales bacterium]|nr:hypothetical protein [Rhodospirillales bacterium]